MNFKKTINQFQNTAGFTLLEVIIAVFIISVGVVGIVKITPSIISGTSVNSSRLTAAYLAQEGIEIIRNIRDTNLLEGSAWDKGVTTMCAGGCEADYTATFQQDPILAVYGTGNYLRIDGSGFYGYAGGSQTKFKRKITVDQESANIIKITSDVFWQERGKNYNFLAQEKLYNWY